jgi:hypothetical protein
LRNFSQADSFGRVPDQNGRPSRPAGPLRYAGAGIEIAAAVGLGALAGQWLDKKTGAAGIFTIVGAMLGFGAALYALIRTLRDPGQNGS